MHYIFFLQLVSELVVLTIRPEDDGTFFCAAQNPAGVARANFTVRLVDNIEDSVSGGTTGSAAGTGGTAEAGLQENTDLLNSAENPDDMFKVCLFQYIDAIFLTPLYILIRKTIIAPYN